MWNLCKHSINSAQKKPVWQWTEIPFYLKHTNFCSWNCISFMTFVGWHSKQVCCRYLQVTYPRAEVYFSADVTRCCKTATRFVFQAIVLMIVSCIWFAWCDYISFVDQFVCVRFHWMWLSRPNQHTICFCFWQRTCFIVSIQPEKAIIHLSFQIFTESILFL